MEHTLGKEVSGWHKASLSMNMNAGLQLSHAGGQEAWVILETLKPWKRHGCFSLRGVGLTIFLLAAVMLLGLAAGIRLQKAVYTDPAVRPFTLTDYLSVSQTFSVIIIESNKSVKAEQKLLNWSPQGNLEKKFHNFPTSKNYSYSRTTTSQGLHPYAPFVLSYSKLS